MDESENSQTEEEVTRREFLRKGTKFAAALLSVVGVGSSLAQGASDDLSYGQQPYGGKRRIKRSNT
jgi:hypothetical protein